MQYENPWTYDDEPVLAIPPECEAFVYLITSKVDGRKYVGKKTLWRTKIRTVNKKKKRERVESDWREYYGSNKGLLTEVEKHGTINFERRVLRFCKTRGEASYYEARYQFEADAILSEEYFNTWISLKVRKDHILPKEKPAGISRKR